MVMGLLTPSKIKQLKKGIVDAEYEIVADSPNLYFACEKCFKSFKDFKLFKIDSVEVEYKQLQYICDLRLLQKDLQPWIDDYLYFPYQDVVNYCSKRENEIINTKKNIFLYELI